MRLDNFLLPGVKRISSSILMDSRGEFRQIYDQRLLADLGVSSFSQVNCSVSSRGVFRGFHLQLFPRNQGKLVQCIKGAILDFVLDPDPDSDTFGRVCEISLNSNIETALWIPNKYAHAFLSLEDGSTVVYAVTQPWDKSLERSINPLSTELAKKYNVRSMLMSDRDLHGDSLRQVALELAGRKAL